MFLRLCAAVMTLAVPELRLLLEFSGITAQLPTKSLLSLRMRQVQGNSPGEDSPCCSPRTGPEYCLTPHCWLPKPVFSWQQYRTSPPLLLPELLPPNSKLPELAELAAAEEGQDSRASV